MKEKVKILFLILGVFLSSIICFGQTNNKEFLYDRNGNRITFNEIDTVVHIGFVSNVSIDTINEVLEALSSIADYTMFPDSSYRFSVKQKKLSDFKENAMAYNCVAYCQNEYSESDNGIVWGTNRILVKMNPDNLIDTLPQLLNIPAIQMVRANNDSPQRWDINVASLHNGIYLVKVVTDNGTETAKFVKK